MKKRLLSLLLALVMVVGLLPMGALAVTVPETVPDGAVAYVTDADGQPIDAGEAGADGENDLGGGFYKTLQAAIAACPTDGTEATITVVADASVTSTLSVSNQNHITIDLNGHEVFGWFTTKGTTALIHNKGYLTLKDSTDTNCNGTGGGKLTNKATNPDTQEIPGYASNVINNEGGHLTIESGYYESLTDTGYASYVVDNNSNSCSSYLTVNGGKLVCNHTDVIRLCCNAGETCENIVTINGGIIAEDNTGDRAIWLQYTSGNAKNKAIVNMNGGRIIGGIATYSFTDLSGDGEADGYFSEDQEKNVEFNIHGGSMDFLKVYTNTGTTCKIDISEKEGINSIPKIGTVNLYKYYGSAEMRKISAGYFNADVSDYVVEGKYCIPNKDKTDAYGVDVSGYKYKIGDEPSTDYAVQILNADGSFKAGYYGFDAALSAVKTGETIQLLKNASADSSHYIGYSGYTEANNFTVDLNGKTLDVNAKNAFRLYEEYNDNFTGITFTNSVPDKGTLNLNLIFSIYESYAGQYCDLLFKDITVNLNADQAIDLGNDGKSASIKLDNATFNSPVTVDFPIYSRNNIEIKTVEGSENKIYQPSEDAYGIYGGGGDVTISGAGDLEIETECFGIYCNVGDVTITGSGDVTISGASKAVNADQQLLINSSGDVSITSDEKGVLCYGGATIGGTGNVTITGDALYAIQVYDYYQGTDTYGLKVTNPNATFKSTNGYAVDVEPYLSGNSYYGDNTSVNITAGTYDGKVYIMPLKGTTKSEITGGTFNGDVQIDVCSDQKLEVSGGTFKAIPTINLYTMWSCSPEVVVKNGEFEKELKIRYGNAITGNGATITGGKFADLEGASIKDSSNRSVKAITGGVFANESYGSGSYTWDSAWTSCIADGYSKGTNNDVLTNVQYPFAVKPYEIKVETAEVKDGEIVSGKTIDKESGEEVDKVIAVDVSKDGAATTETEDKSSAATAITDLVTNAAVGTFVETNIDDATREMSKTVTVGDDSFNISMVLDEAMKAINKEEGGDSDVAAAIDDGKIGVTTGETEQTFTDVDLDKEIIVELEAAKVEITTESQAGTSTVTTVNGSTFDVTPMVTITYKDSEGTEKSVTTKIPNEAITKPITFRLPIDKKLGDSGVTSTAVWHSDDAINFKKDYLGIFTIQKENGEYFIELSASEFSYYTYENMTQLKETNVAAIRTTDGKYVGFDTLQDAINAYGESGEDKVENAEAIILLKDIETGKTYQEDGDPDTVGNQPVKEPDEFNFSGKTIALDLNGHILKGESENAADVTISNNGANQVTLAATGVYANNVKAFVMDGYDAVDYDAETAGIDYRKVVNTAVVDYKVVVNAIATDRDATTADVTEVYAGDIVTVTVTVNGARFVAADLTMKFDPNLVKDVTALEEQVYTWKKESDKNQYRYTSTGGDRYYEDGTVLGTFKFEILPVPETGVTGGTYDSWFKVYDASTEGETTTYNVRPAYVSGSWDSGFNSDPRAALKEEQVTNDYVKVIMMPTMTGSVDAVTGLVYSASPKALVANPSAKVDGVNILNNATWPTAQIRYCLETEQVTGDDAIKTLDYSSTEIPTGEHAGDYYVYYKITADGYTSVYGEKKVTIAKKQATLTWTINSPDVTDQTISFTANGTNKFTGEYNANGFKAPAATFIAQNGNETLPATVTLKKFDGADVAANTELKKVGEYVFEASYKDDNGYEDYTFTPNPTCTVVIEGATITGWTLEPTTDQYVDGKTHPVAKLTLADNAAPAANAEGLEITFRYSNDNGATWTDVVGGPFTTVEAAQAKIPVESTEGTYKLEMTVKADTFKTTTFAVTTFNIKKPVYVVEASEYVAGWTEIRVYTNEDVTFRYDGEDNMLYDVTSFGYRYQNTMSYAHVYALVVEGEANLGKIFASNDPAKSLDLPNNVNIYDVNTNGTTLVTLEDAVAAQSVYNVNSDYMNNKMAIVLRCDVNRDKKVDVAGDVTAILNEYVTNWNA